MVIRPIGPQDAHREQAFVRGLSPESRYFRFMNTLRELRPEMLERFTHPDPAREIALVALTARGAHEPAAGRGSPLRARARRARSGEFAIVVADAFQGKGLGSRLMQELIGERTRGGCSASKGWC